MRTQATALVGRDEELRRIGTALREAHTGQGSGVFLVGEAGIGKTRLATTAIGMGIEHGLVAVRGRSSTVAPMVPFRPLTEALMTLSRRGLLPDPDAFGWAGPVLGHLVPELSRESTRAARPSVIVIAEAFLRILSSVGRERGCLLVLEDLQDVDAETLAVVEYLVDNLHDEPIQLMATLRHEPSSAFDLVSAVRQRTAITVLELDRLDRVAVSELVRTRLPDAAIPVSADVIDLIFGASAGVPFIVEELVYELTKTGRLVSGSGTWHLDDAATVQVPATVVRSVSLRTERLGPQARVVLTLAAAMGGRFSLPVIGRAARIDERSLLTTMHAGVAAQLVIPDEPAPDWYAFRHPLTAEALRAVLVPTERASLSSRLADAIESEHPELPGEWCAQVAALRQTAGEAPRAGRLYAEAGRRALAGGAARSAVTMLELANELLTDSEPSDRANVFESLLFALRETGQFDRVFELGPTLNRLGDDGLPSARRAALHAQLADAAQAAGRLEYAANQLDVARVLLGSEPTAGDLARVDVIAARLQLSRPSPDRLQVAADLAERSAAGAAEAGMPDVACDALQMIGTFTVEVDIGRSNTYLDRARVLAETHHLPIQKLNADAVLAGNRIRIDGSIDAVQQAHREALRLGAIPLAYDIKGILAMQAIRRGDLETAAAIIDEELRVVTRLRLGRARTYLLVTQAVYYAHQAKRPEMETILEELSKDEGHASYASPVTYGLARAYCSLLEEDRERAEHDLEQALMIHAKTPTFLEFGKDGLPVLLRVLAQRDSWAEFREVSASASGHTRWNAQSIHLAHAILLGRDGCVREANAAVTEAREAAAIYPLTYHLGLRLVAQEARDHGWGDPVTWLREAEEFFHQHGVLAVAGACRAMLRQMGAQVRQRRLGTEQIPEVLRQAGVTAREYDVCRLVVDRIGNKAIASRLHISPRTVEKHVASLLAKTNQPDRDALTVFARAVLGD